MDLNNQTLSVLFSKLSENEVPKQVLQTVMEEQDPVFKWDLDHSVGDQRRDLIKIPTESSKKESTYFLPVLTCLGLMSALLKAAKNNSQGAPS